jgi:serine/threonine protein phosphatase PrpC
MDQTVRNVMAPHLAAAPPATLRNHVSAALSHVGKVRRINEDACLDRGDIGLWAVADGVGGAHAGDRASGLIVEALDKLPPPSTAVGFLAQVRDSLQAVNQLLRLEASTLGDKTIASTIVVLLFFGQHYACAWAGDSRLYLLRNGRLRQITRDHSEVQEMVDAGEISPAEARHHPRGNLITRAVGAHDELLLEMVQDQLRPDDMFLLCSDGLTKPIDEAEIARLIAGRSPQEAVEALIGSALAAGAPDNVTVVAVKILAVAETNV